MEDVLVAFYLGGWNPLSGDRIFICACYNVTTHEQPFHSVALLSIPRAHLSLSYKTNKMVNRENQVQMRCSKAAEHVVRIHGVRPS